MTTLLAYSHLFAGLGLGAVTEAGARAMGIGRYRSVAFPFLNVVITFGLVQGLLVGWVIGGRLDLVSIAPVLFMVGAVVGLLVEGLNGYWWRAWSWSDKPLFGIERAIDKAAFIGVVWGFAPILTVMVARMIVVRGLEF
jgi:hypothetical protein